MFNSPSSLYQLCLKAVVDLSNLNIATTQLNDLPGFSIDAEKLLLNRNNNNDRDDCQASYIQKSRKVDILDKPRFISHLENIFFRNNCLTKTFLSDSSKSASSQNSNYNDFYRVNSTICEDLLNSFQKHREITDRVLKLPLFNGSINQLENVEIENGKSLTEAGLSVLEKHKILRLKVGHLSSCTVNQLINCLSDYSRKHLQSLSVPYSSFSRLEKLCIILKLTNLPNLTSLDVSNTDFTNHGLDIIATDLRNLTSLNISATKVTHLEPLTRCKNRLHKLVLQNVSATCRDEHVLTKLTNLCYLDISEDRYYFDNNSIQDQLNLFFTSFLNFPNLIELDISGRNVNIENLLTFLSTKSIDLEHCSLKFVGLFDTIFQYSHKKLFDNQFNITISCK